MKKGATLLILVQGRIFAVLGRSDTDERIALATRKDEQWGWLVTFSSAEEQQQDMDPSPDQPRVVLSYRIPYSSEMSWQT